MNKRNNNTRKQQQPNNGKRRVRQRARPKVVNQKRRENRAKRRAQLSAQYEALRTLKSEGNPIANALPGQIIKGRGDYSLQQLGTDAGSWLATKAEGFLKKIFGRGDYMVQPPDIDGLQANSMVASATTAEVANSTPGCIDVIEHEYLGSFGHTVDFTNTTFPIRIDNAQLFPWLHQAAPMYQQYQILGMIFYIKTLSADTVVAPTQGVGMAGMFVQYDPLEPAVTDDITAINRLFASSGKISTNQACAVECRRDQTMFPIMKIPVPGQLIESLAEYQFGTFNLWTSGAANDYPRAFQVYVTYHIRLMKQRIQPIGGPLFMLDLLANDRTAPLTPVADSALVPQPRINSLGVILEATHTKLVFPLNLDSYYVYQINWTYSGSTSSANIGTLGLTFSGGLSGTITYFDQSQTTVLSPAAPTNTGAGNQILINMFYYDGSGTEVDPPSILFSVSSGGYPSGIIGGTLIITAVNPLVSSGLTLRHPVEYTRSEFYKYLAAAVNHQKSVHTPPKLGTIADWVHQFTKTNTWPYHKKLPPSPYPFDLTLSEAYARIGRYEADNENEDASVAVLREQVAMLTARLDRVTHDDFEEVKR